MAKIIITQSILWAAAIISTALVAPSDSGWLLLTVLATISIGTLKNGINSIKNGQEERCTARNLISHCRVKLVVPLLRTKDEI